MHIKPFPAAYPIFENISSVHGFFNQVKEKYSDFKKKGYFQKADHPAYYIYEIQGKSRSHTGLIALAAIEDYLDGRIKIHEKTLASKEKQQIKLLLAREAQVKPVLLTCNDVGVLEKYLTSKKNPQKLFYQTTFEDSQEVHTLWAVDDPSSMQALSKMVEDKIPEAYIADGHHRSGTMAQLYKKHLEHSPNPFSHLLVALFPNNQLKVHDYNRVVEGLSHSSVSRFVVLVSQICNITPLEEGQKPMQKHQLTMFINREWYLLEWRKELLEKYKGEKILLDAELLDRHIFDYILGITDVRNDGRLKYVEGPAGIEGLLNKALKNENRIGFCLFPIELKDLMAIADRKGVMPPKSTWFEPRIKNGLVVLDLDIPK